VQNTTPFKAVAKGQSPIHKPSPTHKKLFEDSRRAREKGSMQVSPDTSEAATPHPLTHFARLQTILGTLQKAL
jgi:hypothetical protein